MKVLLILVISLCLIGSCKKDEPPYVPVLKITHSIDANWVTMNYVVIENKTTHKTKVYEHYRVAGLEQTYTDMKCSVGDTLILRCWLNNDKNAATIRVFIDDSFKKYFSYDVREEEFIYIIPNKPD